MARHVPGRATLVATLHVLASTAGVAAASTGAGQSTGRAPPLRALVRHLGDGTALGPAADAIAALGTDALWTDLTVVLLGGTGVVLVAFGPILLAVAFHWTYRRLRWVFWGAVGALRRGVSALARLALRAARRSTDEDETAATRERPSREPGTAGDRPPAD